MEDEQVAVLDTELAGRLLEAVQDLSALLSACHETRIRARTGVTALPGNGSTSQHAAARPMLAV
jgi:hypothetical protein